MEGGGRGGCSKGEEGGWREWREERRERKLCTHFSTI